MMNTAKLTWTRKVQKIKATYYIAVPIQWAKANNLERHADVLIELQKDGKITLEPEKTEDWTDKHEH